MLWYLEIRVESGGYTEKRKSRIVREINVDSGTKDSLRFSGHSFEFPFTIGENVTLNLHYNFVKLFYSFCHPGFTAVPVSKKKKKFKNE